MATKKIYGKFELSDGRIIEIATPHILPDESAAPKDILWPMIEIGDARGTDHIVDQTFDNWFERWCSYKDVPYLSNVWYPLSHARAGGHDGGGYIWTDHSRWNIDAPEVPNSNLWAVVYWRWLNRNDIVTSRSAYIGLNGWTMTCHLKGRNLDLKGAGCYFWVTTEQGRWHKTGTPLTINNTGWTANSVLLDGNGWSQSWSRGGNPLGSETLNLSAVESWGFSFRDFPRGEPVEGVACLDAFRLTKP